MRVPLGYAECVTLGTAKGFHQFTPAMPAGAQYATVSVEAQSVRWRDDGTDPTAAVGHLLTAGTYRDFDITNVGDNCPLRFIEVTAGARVRVTFYKQA